MPSCIHINSVFDSYHYCTDITIDTTLLASEEEIWGAFYVFKILMASCNILMALCNILMALCNILMALCNILMALCNILMTLCNIMQNYMEL